MNGSAVSAAPSVSCMGRRAQRRSKITYYLEQLDLVHVCIDARGSGEGRTLLGPWPSELDDFQGLPSTPINSISHKIGKVSKSTGPLAFILGSTQTETTKNSSTLIFAHILTPALSAPPPSQSDLAHDQEKYAQDAHRKAQSSLAFLRTPQYKHDSAHGTEVHPK